MVVGVTMAKLNNILDDLRVLLMGGDAGTQDELCKALESKGHEVNQSKVSRLLRKVGAIKTKNEDGAVVYALPWEPAPPTLDNTISSLLVGISANEAQIIITSSPGSAQLIARILDFHREKLGILGTIAGDDTILVIPNSIHRTEECLKEIKYLLF